MKKKPIKNNQALPVEPKQNNGFKAVIFLAIGLFIGALGMHYFTPIIAVADEKEDLLPVKRKAYNLVNPILEQPKFRQYNLTKVPELSEKVEERVAQLKAQKKASSISVYYRDLTNDDWFGINEKEIFSPASLMKVPVMIAVLSLVEERPELLRHEMFFKERREQAYIEKGDQPLNTTTSLIPGRNYNIDELLEIMILESDNEATILLLDFLDAENPQHLMKVQDDLGLHVPRSVRNTDSIVSVKVYSSFFRTLYNASYLSDDLSEKALGMLTRTGYGYGIRQAIPKEVIVSQKFGYKSITESKKQLHHFGIVYHAKKPFLIGVMTKGKKEEDLKLIISSIASIIYEEVDMHTRNDSKNLQRDLD